MANYEAHCRSNYFRVKDEAAFRTWAESLYLTVIEQDGPVVQDRRLGIHPDPYADEGWPSYDPELDQEIDLEAQLQEHLAPGEVAILMEVGHEKLRYLAASARIVTATAVEYLDFSTLVAKAAQRHATEGIPVTAPEY